MTDSDSVMEILAEYHRHVAWTPEDDFGLAVLFSVIVTALVIVLIRVGFFEFGLVSEWLTSIRSLVVVLVLVLGVMTSLVAVPTMVSLHQRVSEARPAAVAALTELVPVIAERVDDRSTTDDVECLLNRVRPAQLKLHRWNRTPCRAQARFGDVVVDYVLVIGPTGAHWSNT